jgi:hypothetical protein
LLSFLDAAALKECVKQLDRCYELKPFQYLFGDVDEEEEDQDDIIEEEEEEEEEVDDDDDDDDDDGVVSPSRRKSNQKKEKEGKRQQRRRGSSKEEAAFCPPCDGSLYFVREGSVVLSIGTQSPGYGMSEEDYIGFDASTHTKKNLRKSSGKARNKSVKQSFDTVLQKGDSVWYTLTLKK